MWTEAILFIRHCLPSNKPWEIIREGGTGSKEVDGRLVPSPTCALQTNNWKQTLGRSLWDAACSPGFPGIGVGLESGSPFLSLLVLALVAAALLVHSKLMKLPWELGAGRSSGFHSWMDSEEVWTEYQWHSDSECRTQQDNHLPRHNAYDCFPPSSPPTCTLPSSLSGRSTSLWSSHTLGSFKWNHFL